MLIQADELNGNSPYCEYSLNYILGLKHYFTFSLCCSQAKIFGRNLFLESSEKKSWKEILLPKSRREIPWNWSRLTTKVPSQPVKHWHQVFSFGYFYTRTYSISPSYIFSNFVPHNTEVFSMNVFTKTF